MSMQLLLLSGPPLWWQKVPGTNPFPTQKKPLSKWSSNFEKLNPKVSSPSPGKSFSVRVSFVIESLDGDRVVKIGKWGWGFKKEKKVRPSMTPTNQLRTYNPSPFSSNDWLLSPGAAFQPNLTPPLPYERTLAAPQLNVDERRLKTRCFSLPKWEGHAVKKMSLPCSSFQMIIAGPLPLSTPPLAKINARSSDLTDEVDLFFWGRNLPHADKLAPTVSEFRRIQFLRQCHLQGLNRRWFNNFRFETFFWEIGGSAPWNYVASPLLVNTLQVWNPFIPSQTDRRTEGRGHY